MERFSFREIEKKWQNTFSKENLYIKGAKKFYCLEMFHIFWKNSHGSCEKLYYWGCNC